MEKAGDALSIVKRQAQADFEDFKSFIEVRPVETGAWRGDVEGTTLGTPGVEEATSHGDSGKAASPATRRLPPDPIPGDSLGAGEPLDTLDPGLR